MFRPWLCYIMTLTTLGCSGQYVMTAPDQIAPVGSSVATVVRLRRHELTFLTLPVKKGPVRFSIADSPLRCAYTDNSGYAASAVPVPEKPGLYAMTIATQDIHGDEYSRDFPAYVWDKDKAIVAVDLEAVPLEGKEAASAQAALTRIANDANIIYLTRRDVDDYENIHQRIVALKLPDGALLPWRRSDWRGSRMASQLPQLREQFTNLNFGICGSQAAVNTFSAAGMECIVVGTIPIKGAKVAERSWADLTEKGL
jgi:hypothetical protein